MQIHIARTTLSHALGLALLGMASGPALAQAQEQPQPQAQEQSQAEAQSPTAGQPQPQEQAQVPVPAQADAADQVTELDRVVVTGYRQSIQFATDAKRESTNFTDSIFAEDIGKFPDLNIAESLNRIPGIQLSRDVNGEGVNISIRGLGTSFTKTLLNGSQIAVASTGGTDSQNQNREVDLDLFPTELFTQLTVNKTPMASMIEGGVAGVVNMRSARPFDNPGKHLTYQLQGGYGEVSEKFSPRGAVTGSWTNDEGTFGALVGIAAVHNKLGVEGFETIGWTNPNLTYAQCGLTPPDGTPATNPAAECNTGGGNGWVIPATVPPGAGAGLVAGTTIDRDFLLANNPGLTIDQLSEARIPRLGRPAYMEGDRDRVATLMSFELRPNEDMNFYLDMLYADADRSNDRIDMDLIGRNGAIIPTNLQVDGNNVVTSGTLANAQFFLEARPYRENLKFYNINPGAQIFFGENDDIKLDVQASMGRSWFFRESPSILVTSPVGAIEYDNSGGDIPTWTTGVDLNDPNAGWSWAGGRLNIQNEKRVTENKGARADLQFGEDKRNVKVGFAYDDIERRITSFDNSGAWEDVACRGLNPDGTVPDPRPGCVGGPLSAVPQDVLSSYLMPGPYGFITVDFDRFMDDTNYRELSDNAPENNSSNTGAGAGSVREKNLGAYVEINGEADVWNRPLRFNAGVRYVTTDQEIGGPVMLGSERVIQVMKSDYDEILPSFNAAWDVADDVVLRMSGSRTLTRPNPSVMRPNTNFSDPSAQTATQGNPELAPYLSTNVDIGGEWYTGDEGFVGVTMFSKRVNGFTVNGIRTIPFLELGVPFEDLTETQQLAINQRGGPDAATVDVQSQVNADGVLDIRGWELIWVQPLDRLFEGLGFMTNYTHVSQTAEGEGVPAVAEGVAPNLWNATAYWENDLASVRLSYTWTDDMISSGANQNGIPDARILTDARGQLDLSASYTLSQFRSSPQITLNVINITGEPMRSTFQYDNAAFTYYDPGYTILLGVRGTF